MLNNSYTLGTTTAALTYVKQFSDENKAQFAVSGLASTAARTWSVSHQPASNGRRRSVISLDRVDVNPGSAAGETAKSRLYIVQDRAPFLTEAQCQDDRIRLKTLVDDASFWSAFCNGES